MIPSDVTSRLQVSADTALRQVAPAQEITDKLSGLVAGQKVMAEIQSLLPNGTYRAMINQRNITLALPFSAKSGDSLELLVTDSDGKLALAVVARPEGEAAKPAAPATSATLSRTGQLISTLLSTAGESKDRPAALALNGNQPISAAPGKAQDLLPLLKQAIAQSGMFYESHQAEWVEGRFTQAALLREPQGRLSMPSAFSAALADDPSAPAQAKPPAGSEGAAASSAPRSAGESAPRGDAAIKGDVLPTTPRLVADGASTASADAGKTGAAQNTAQVVAPQAQAVVQQQLEALATQNFSWQGQVWPGQDMRWDIDEDAARRNPDDDETAAKWSTRLRLELPTLGDIDAQIRLQGNQITLVMTAGSAETRTLLCHSGVLLRSQFDEAGLTLATMGVAAATESASDGQAG